MRPENGAEEAGPGSGAGGAALMAEQREARAQLAAQDQNIVDMWHELGPTRSMVEATEEKGLPPPTLLGAVRLRTWIKRSEVGHHTRARTRAPGA